MGYTEKTVRIVRWRRDTMTALDLLLACGLLVLINQSSIFSTTIYLHRYLTHQSLRDMHWSLELVFRSILWITTGQRRREWVAVHAKHHAFTDRAGDPHSPKLIPPRKLWFTNFIEYGKAAKEPGAFGRYAPHIREDWLDRTFFNRGTLGLAIGVSALLIFCSAWLGWQWGVLVGTLISLAQFALYVWGVAPLINVAGHLENAGRKDFNNTARNWRLFAWISGGESLHNNHHQHPKAPKFSMRRMEFDPAWPIIKLLASIGAVRITGSMVRR